ncbi:MAG: isoprenyl transferase [candidate division WOR-3 bacterium]
MKSEVPQHVAIIMDGNGRWARERGLPRYLGHKAGAESVREVIRISRLVGIKYLTLYTFSLENWKRPEREVRFLMRMLSELIADEVEMLVKNNVRIDFIGKLDLLPQSLKEEIKKAREKTDKCDGLKVFLALSYGGRAEIVDAVKNLVKSGFNIDELTEETFKKFTYLPEIPDPDLLIRTGGEVRISNFLLWHIAYTEFYFTKTLWPDFRSEEFLRILEDFAQRQRRFGGVPEG